MGVSSSVPILKSEILKLTLDWTLLFSTKKCRCLLSIRGACRRMYRNWLHSLPHWKNKAEQADDFSGRNRKKILHKSLFRVCRKFSSRAALPGTYSSPFKFPCRRCRLLLRSSAFDFKLIAGRSLCCRKARG